MRPSTLAIMRVETLSHRGSGGAARKAIVIAWIVALGGCASGQWTRAGTTAAETETNLAACVAFERANAQTVLVPQTFKSRDGSSATYFFPQHFPAAGRDRAACMRQRGFVLERAQTERP
jgi:hypothetical protein